MARLIALCAGVALSGAILVGAQAPPVDLVSWLDAYAAGRADEAVAAAVAASDVAALRLQFVQRTPIWVAADPAQSSKRRAAAAGFILEVAQARLDTDWGRLSDLVEWTCHAMRAAGPPTAFERAWDEGSIALASRARARRWLLGDSPRLPHQKAVQRPVSPNLPPSPMHLVHVMDRFPDDPSFRLAQVVAWTWGRDAEPMRNVHAREHETVVRVTPPQLEALITLEPLTRTPSVAAEAFVRVGHLLFSARRSDDALHAFESAAGVATDPSMKYIAHLSAGRTREALGQPAEAMRAYATALEVVPGAESATLALSSLQFEGDEHDAAVARLDRVFADRVSTADPGRLIGYGTFVRWPALKAAMRAEIPR